ncbi:MAG TPA: hypothetical protein VG738_22960 [Chitinophagaceae bacterium]|nr:hypothetical protein [Chitinophagaceae bacterium]
MPKKIILLLPFCSCLFLNDCKKSSTPAETSICDNIKNVKITNVSSLYFPGDAVNINANVSVDGTYTWHFGADPAVIATGTSFGISSVTKYDEGWYYLTVTNAACDPYTDSAYIRIVDKPLTPTCNPADNKIVFSGIPGITLDTLAMALDTASNSRVISSPESAGKPGIKIYLNPYWTAHNYEDGEYATASALNFPEHEIYNVFISASYQGNQFTSVAGGQVYLWHDQGRTRITICTATLVNSSGGSPQSVTVTGEVNAR